MSQQLTKEGLEEAVNTALTPILSREENLRCHEVERLLKRSLQEQGFPVVLRDGTVNYQNQFLLGVSPEGLQEISSVLPLIDQETVEDSKGRTGRIAHSWLEVGEFTVDYHIMLNISGKTTLFDKLIVQRTVELEGKASYDPSGKEFTVRG